MDGSVTLAITFFEAFLIKMSSLRSVTQDKFPFSWSWAMASDAEKSPDEGS